MVYVRLAVQQRAVRIIGLTLCYTTPWVVFFYNIFSAAEVSSLSLGSFKKAPIATHFEFHIVNQANVS